MLMKSMMQPERIDLFYKKQTAFLRVLGGHMRKVSKRKYLYFLNMPNQTIDFYSLNITNNYMEWSDI